MAWKARRRGIGLDRVLPLIGFALLFSLAAAQCLFFVQLLTTQLRKTRDSWTAPQAYRIACFQLGALAIMSLPVKLRMGEANGSVLPFHCMQIFVLALPTVIMAVAAVGPLALVKLD